MKSIFVFCKMDPNEIKTYKNNAIYFPNLRGEMVLNNTYAYWYEKAEMIKIEQQHLSSLKCYRFMNIIFAVRENKRNVYVYRRCVSE